MTLTCQICGRQRAQENIGIFNQVQYCLDRPECVAKGKTRQLIGLELQRLRQTVHPIDPFRHAMMKNRGISTNV